MTDAPSPEVSSVIGHRGACGYAPENTLVSLREAARRGVRWVEFDVMLSRDGVPVLFHDEMLSRTTDGEGRVSETDWADLQNLDAGCWRGAAFEGERIPTLDQAMAVLAELGMGANVEIKPAAGHEVATGEAVGRLLDNGWPAELPPPLLSSFSEAALDAARRAAPTLPRAALVPEIPPDWQAMLERLAATSLHCAHDRLDAATVAVVRRAGVPLRCYTVNEPTRAATLFAWGVSSVFSDVPDKILRSSNGLGPT